MPLAPAGFRQQLATLLHPFLKESDLVGFAAGYATYHESEGSHHHYCYLGQVEDQFTGNAATPSDSTLWELGSSTKSVTAALFALQAMAGQVTPGDSAGTWLSSWFSDGKVPSQLQQITLEQLAAMNAGLAGQCNKLPPSFPGGNPCKVFDPYLTDRSSYGTAGSFSYSDLSYALLSYAMVASLTTPPSCGGLPATLLSQYGTQLFQPLGMTTPVFYPPSSDGGTYTFPYGIVAGGKKVDGNNPSWPAFDGAGGLVMTAPDFLTWLRANMGALGDASPLGTDELLFLRSDPFSTDCNGQPYVEGQLITRGWFLNHYTGQYSGKERHIYAKHGAVEGFYSGVAYRDPSTVRDQPSGAPSNHGVFLLTNCGFISGKEFVILVQQLMDYVIEQGPSVRTPAES